MMQRTIKSSRIIIINSILVLFLIIILVAQNIFLLEKNNSVLSNIDDDYNRKLDVIILMSKIVQQRTLHMVTMYLSRDAWEQDKIFTDFHKLKLDFLKLNNELKFSGLEDNEKILFDKIMNSLNQTELIQIDIVERIQSGGDKKLRSDISLKDIPLENKVLSIFDDLIEIIRSNAIQARKNAKQQYQDSINLALIISLLIFIVAVFIMKRALSQIKKIESGLIHDAESMSWDATHDALTNIYNRRWIKHKLELLQNDAQNDSLKHSLLYIDLDEFKPVNDNYGHVVGDNFLCGITREFEKCIRQNDTLARMGGDEFAILLENCDVDKASEIAECLISHVEKFSIEVKNKKVKIKGCSIGINEFFGSSIIFSELVKQADSACYEAKNRGKDQFRIFSN